MFTLSFKKIIIGLLTVVVSSSLFGQAEVRATFDTVTGMPGEKRYDTLVKFGIDTTLKYVTKTPYQVTIGVNPNILTSSSSSSGLWTQNLTLPTRIYVGAGTNTYTNVGIGTDTARASLQIQKSIAISTYDTGIYLNNPITVTSGNYATSPSIIMEGKTYSQTVSPLYQRAAIRQTVVPVANTGSGAATPYYNWDFFDPSLSGINPYTNVMQLIPRNIAGASPSGGLAIGSVGNANGRINVNVTAYQIDNNNGGQPLLIGNGNGGLTLNTNFYMNGNGVVYQAPYTGGQTGIGFGVNDYSSQTFSRTGTIGDFQVRLNSMKGFGLPLMLGSTRDSMTSRVTGWTVTSGGSGYPSGNINGAGTTAVTGIGTGATAFLVVSGGVITGVGLSVGGADGKNYKVGDQVSVPAVSGQGSGGILTVSSISTFTHGITVVDTSTNQISYHIGTGNNWTGRVVTVSAATYNPLAYGADYIFTGSGGTYSLPAVNSRIAGRQNEIHLINESSGTVTINSDTGSTLYTTSLQSSITVAAGATAVLFPTGSNLKVKYNQ